MMGVRVRTMVGVKVSIRVGVGVRVKLGVTATVAKPESMCEVRSAYLRLGFGSLGWGYVCVWKVLEELEARYSNTPHHTAPHHTTMRHRSAGRSTLRA